VEGGESVRVVCEQVSHHPPTTAAFIEDEVNGVRVSSGLMVNGVHADLNERLRHIQHNIRRYRARQ
jgi:hypothetical protein